MSSSHARAPNLYRPTPISPSITHDSNYPTCSGLIRRLNLAGSTSAPPTPPVQLFRKSTTYPLQVPVHYIFLVFLTRPSPNIQIIFARIGITCDNVKVWGWKAMWVLKDKEIRSVLQRSVVTCISTQFEVQKSNFNQLDAIVIVCTRENLRER